MTRLVVAIALLFAAPAFAEAPYELVYTAPAEANLEVPGVRAPAPVWIDLFGQAKKSIDLEEFYLADEKGEALSPVLDALEKAARRGVHVRVLVEAVMVKQSQPVLDRLATWPNTETRVIKYGQLEGGIVHAKFFVVDGKLAYEGSQNFDWRSLTHIHELGVRIADAAVAAELQSIFDLDWKTQAALAAGQPAPPARKERTAPPKDAAAYLVASPWDRLPDGIGDSESELVRLIGTAKKHIRVQTLEYAPLHHDRSYYATLDDALRAAAARGVEVELMVSNWNADRPDIQWLKSFALVPHVQVKMVTLPEAKRGFIPYARVVHSKYMILDDDLLWVGTSNWQGGYFDQSRNVEMVLKDPTLVSEGAAIFTKLWGSPYAEPLDVAKDYPLPRRK
jgi:phosphatidylserine/phosphatidylglycerophosphate/cardiolipin synthase-like enzyme